MRAALFECLLPFLTAFGSAVALTPGVRALARRLGLYARPAPDRWHRQPVARLGGVAIAAAALSGALTAELSPLLPLLVASMLMFILGIVDDVTPIKPPTKLVGQMVIAALLTYLAPAVDLTGSPPVDTLLAFAWIVGITNAFNLIDNIDGLAAGIAAIAGAFYLAILLPSGATPLTSAIAAVTGAALGFLLYNLQPASIFMGDSGSLFLGSFLAGVSLLAAPEFKPQLLQVAIIPVLVLLIPIFDTTFVALMRTLAGRSILIGGRDHSSHRLVALGVGERRAMFGLCGLAAAGGAIALTVRHLSFGYTAILIGLYLILILSLGVVLGHVDAWPGGDGERSRPSRTPLVSEIAYRNRLYEVLLDVALLALAYYAAFRIRFAEPQFTQFLPYFATSFPIVIGCQLAALWFTGKYRQVWGSFSRAELMNIQRGILVGVVASVILVLYLYRFEGFSRGVFLIDGAILSFLLVGSRVAIGSADDYLHRYQTRGRHALIYGAGRGGRLLVGELRQNPVYGLIPVGFLDDDPDKRRLIVEGLPVVGGLADLPAVLARHGVAEVVVSIRDIGSQELAALSRVCRARHVAVRRMHLSLAPLDEPEPALQPVGHDV